MKADFLFVSQVEWVLKEPALLGLTKLAQQIHPHRFATVSEWAWVLLMVAMRMLYPIARMLSWLGVEEKVTVDRLYCAMDWLNQKWQWIGNDTHFLEPNLRPRISFLIPY